MDPSAVEILYEGSKYFGSTNTLFHIAIVEHASHDIIEVVSYDKRYSVEAPSVYLKCSTLLLRIDQIAVRSRILDLTEEAEERDMLADESKIVKIAVGESMFDFLADRLFASATGVNRAKLEFKLLQKDFIIMPGQNPLCSKPEELEPFSYASVLMSEGQGLSCRKKWCTPVMLAKVSRSRSLQRRNSKAWEEEPGLLSAESDADSFTLLGTMTRANSDVGSQAGSSVHWKETQRWTLPQHPFLAVAEGTAPATQNDALHQQSQAAQRQGSISTGYEAIISSLQRGLSVMHSTSIKSSKVAVSIHDDDAGDSFRVGAMKIFTTPSVSSAVAGEPTEPQAPRSISQGATMTGRYNTRHLLDLAREASASAIDTGEPKADQQPALCPSAAEAEIDPLAGLSPCNRANRELRAARYLATVAANLAAVARGASVTRPDLRVDTAAGPRGGTPKSNRVPSSPSVRLQQAAESLKSGVSGILHPVLLLLEVVTRKNNSAVVVHG